MKVRGSPVFALFIFFALFCAVTALNPTPMCQAAETQSPVTMTLSAEKGGGSVDVVAYDAMALPSSNSNSSGQAEVVMNADTATAATDGKFRTECCYVMVGNGLGNANWPVTIETAHPFTIAVSGTPLYFSST